MPIDGQWNPDGSRLQGWLKTKNSSRTPVSPMAGSSSKMGLIIKRHDKDANTNVHGNAAEYDVLLFENYLVLPNVPVKGMRLNRDTGDMVILKPASSFPEVGDPTTADLNMLQSDGDLVCVDFVSSRYPLISGTMNHIKSGEDTAPYYPVGSDGEQRKIYHKGSEFTMEEDGDIRINVPSGKGVTINIDGNQALRVYESGGNIKVELGTTATEALILGDAFKTWWDNNVQGHVHATPAGPTTTITAGALPPVPGDLSFDPTTLSTVVKTE